ncbi:MAG: thioredoxin family protein [Micavibrio aeruginosavorus]|nr:thioredoxin family protein [Micavibrio aeruginosavorus]
MKHLLIFLLALFLIPGLALAQQGAELEHVRIELIPARTHVAAGEILPVAIRQSIEPGWHTYWINPGDSGATPRFSWTLPESVRAGPVQWPAPHRIPYANLVNLGYEGQVTLLQEMSLPDPLPSGPLTLAAKSEILVCKDICIPEFKTLTLSLNDPDRPAVDNSAVIAAARALLPIPFAGTGTYKTDGDDLVVTVTGNVIPEPARSDVTLLPVEWGIVKNSAATRIDHAGENALILRQERDTRDLSEISSLPVLLAYSTEEGQYTALELTLAPDPALAAAAPQAAPQETQVPQQQEAQVPPQVHLNFLQAVLFALLGGVILNLMPCVFPVLSIKALKLVQLREQGQGALLASGLAYTAGILLSFALLGGALLAVRAAGSAIGWGFQLQNPLVILGLCYLLFVIGLNLSGLFGIGGAFTNAGGSLAAKNGLTGTFFTGVLATLVATPCTAPFMAGALGYALTQSGAVAMAVFLALGLGLALPYLLFCIVPKLIRALPRPGIWMVKFKEILAFPMYASAAWLVWVFAMQTGPAGILWALCGMVAIAFALWLLMHRPENRTGRTAIIALALLALLFAATPFLHKGVLQIPGPEAAPEARLSAAAFSESLLAQNLAGENPVFVYMTAAWCITCKVNERVALDAPETIALFRTKNVVTLKGDWTNMNPEITAFLKSYGRSGVPLYVFYGPPDKATGIRPEPLVLPQILTPGIVARAIE